mmetsp:Transcript_69165/g.192546  ORF Transcript_69165/g.192546 Transcript_69165/m.192546 type:complete len:238 (+) Transcript_69165:265-978(+)
MVADLADEGGEQTQVPLHRGNRLLEFHNADRDLGHCRRKLRSWLPFGSWRGGTSVVAGEASLWRMWRRLANELLHHAMELFHGAALLRDALQELLHDDIRGGVGERRRWHRAGIGGLRLEEAPRGRQLLAHDGAEVVDRPCLAPQGLDELIQLSCIGVIAVPRQRRCLCRHRRSAVVAQHMQCRVNLFQLLLLLLGDGVKGGEAPLVRVDPHVHLDDGLLQFQQVARVVVAPLGQKH